MYSFGILAVAIICSNELFVASQIKFTSQYNGSKVFGYIGSSVNFTWTFTGDILSADFGTKRSDTIAIKDQLVSLRKNGPLPLVLPALYDGRVSGSWDGTTPGQLTYSLTSIQQEDNRIFLCELTPVQIQLSSAADQVQLIVRDHPNAQIISPDSKVMSAREGSSARFTCNASGIPLPSIRWMKHSGSSANEIVADNVKYQVTSGSGSSQLMIKDIADDDQGYYSCNASSYEFHLDRVFLGVISLIESKDACPSTNQKASMDEPTTICCPVSGFPPPEVTWQFPDGTVQKAGNTILPITPNTKNDFGTYTCSAEGLKETDPDPVIVSIKLEEKGKKTEINATKIQKLGNDDKFKWNTTDGALGYVLNIRGLDIYPVSLLGDNKTGIEIPYSTLNFTNPDNKPNPVEVIIDILAIGHSEVVGEGRNFTVEIRATATTPGVSFILGIVLFMSAITLQ